MTQKRMKRNCIWLIVFVVVTSLYGIILSPGAFASEYNIYGALQDFTWKEFGDDGSRMVKESGTLVGIGFVYWHEFQNHVTLQPKAEIFGGTVDYNGQACSITTGVCQPATSKVDYFGGKLEGDVGRRFRSTQTFLEPFGGLGLRAWGRNIRDGTAADGSATSGYLEEWYSFYLRAGARGGVDLPNRKQVFAEAGIKYPLYNQNTAYQSSIGLSDVTLHPGRMPSLFAEVGMKIDRFKGSLFYEGFRFSKSPVVSDGAYLFWQPESSSDIFGLRAGVSF